VQTPDFKSGRVAILGVGREGQAAREYLRKRYPGIRLTLITESAPGAGFQQQLSPQDQLVIGPLSEAGLEDFDILVRSPGVSPYRQSIRRASAAGAVITTPSNLWFAGHATEKTICITGTKGKSTTSALLAHMLECCGFRVQLAGNIGLPLLSCERENIDWWVIELSSYQLADLEASPSVSVVLNLSSEHLDWHGDEATYREDKLRLVTLAGDQPLVANAADPVLGETLAGRANTVWFNSESGVRASGDRLLDSGCELEACLPDGLPGAHNRSNAAAALTVLRVIGADFSSGLRSIASFRCLPHRLQTVGERAGVRFVDDSISSTPVATAAALETFAGKKVTLIVGGLDRGLDWAPYMCKIRQYLPNVVIGIPDNGGWITGKMRQADITPAGGIHELPDLAAAVEMAREVTPPGGIVLLSPGAPSFPQFEDYRDRGRQFAEFSGFVASGEG
jgi:UDP-N-acetylmuramoylalanine--D-glutamate ligase